MEHFENTIVLVGNTGVGKSFISNQFFEICGSSTRFKSTDSNKSVTQVLQSGQIQYKGKIYTLVDTPGFFDISASGTSNDGPNMCKLVKALENCQQIVSVVFVYTDRFSTPHQVWFERIKNILGEAHGGHIVLVHNKLGQLDVDVKAENKTTIRKILNSTQEYVWLSFQPDQSQVKSALDTVTKFSPFNLSGLQIPEICYQKCFDEPPYEEEICRNTRDEGHMETRTKDTSHYETRSGWDGDFGKIFGIKKYWDEWVTSSVQEQVWIKNSVTRRTLGTFINTYKVRFDGSKDLQKKTEISRREELL